MDHVLLPKNIPTDCSYHLTYYKFSKETHQEYMHALNDLKDMYIKKSTYEEKVLHKKDLVITTSILSVSNLGFSSKVTPGESMMDVLDAL